LYGAIVFSTQCAKKLISIDASRAILLPGVVDVLTAKDIPGANQGIVVQLVVDGYKSRSHSLGK